ncbi:hypothetical protein D9M68_810240 [compost metagenome]
MMPLDRKCAIVAEPSRPTSMNRKFVCDLADLSPMAATTSATRTRSRFSIATEDDIHASSSSAATAATCAAALTLKGVLAALTARASRTSDVTA